MHTALCWAGSSPEDITWIFLPGACSDLSGFTQASSSFGKRKGNAVSTSLEISAKSSWTLQGWRTGWEQIPVRRLSPASLQKAPLPPLFPWSLRVNHKSLLHSHGLLYSYLRTVCKQLHRHPSLLPGGSMGCGQRQQQAAPRAAHPAWGCMREKLKRGVWHASRAACAPPSSPICQSLQHPMTAICHSDPRAEWHHSHHCGVRVSLCSAAIKPGSRQE